MTVVADTSPLNYLVLIGEIDILPILYGTVLISPAVLMELQDPVTPAAVRQWIATRPDWIQVVVPQSSDLRFAGLGRGEREAISLGVERSADLLLMDERSGRAMADTCGIRVAGTLRVLTEAAKLNLLILPEAFGRLGATNFRVSPKLVTTLLLEFQQELGPVTPDDD